MKKMIFLLTALLTCFLGVNVYAADCAYEARNVMYVPIKEGFTGLGFNVDVRPDGVTLIKMKDKNGAEYTIHINSRIISKVYNGNSEGYTPSSPPQIIGTEYFMDSRIMQDCFGVTLKQDEAGKNITLFLNGTSHTLPYKTTTYEAIQKGNDAKTMPEEVIKTAPEPKNGFLIDGVTYAPIRYTFESLGYEVEYKDSTKMIYLYDADYSYAVYIGAKQIVRGNFVSGNKLYEPDYMPKKIGDSYYLPLRVMSQVIEADIGWDQDTKTAHIAKGGKDCYVKCYVYTEPENPDLADPNKPHYSFPGVRTGYIFLPNGQVIIVQTR